ncbi:hypothetical protein Tco_0673356 [Tanacetum coccineum]
MAVSTKALIAEFASTPTPPSPPPSPLSPWSSPLPQIPSPPLPLPSPPTYTSPTYAEVPLGYKAAMIQMRATSPPPIPSPPLLLPSFALRDDIPKANMPLWKRFCLTAPAFRFEVRESSSDAAARQTGHTLACRVDYGFIDTMDASIRASKSRAMTAVGEDDRALLRAQVSSLTRERRYFCSMDFSYKREAVIARQAWSHSEDRSTILEASIRTLEAQRQRQKAGDMATSAFGHIHALEARDRPMLETRKVSVTTNVE